MTEVTLMACAHGPSTRTASILLALLTASAAVTALAADRVVTPTVGDSFELSDAFETVEPTLASSVGARIPGWAGAGHMILLKDGRLLLAYSSDSRMRLIASGDGGGTWTEPTVIDAPLPEAFADAKIHRPAVVEARDGTLWLFFYALIKYDKLNPDQSVNPLWATSSRDGGRTWAPPRMILDGYVGMLQGAIETRAGHLVVPVCRYSGVYRFTSLCAVSTDGGRTWRASNALDVDDPPPATAPGATPLSPVISRGAIEPSVAELPDGRLLMLIRTIGDAFFQSTSTDGGLTWSPATRSPLSCGGPGNLVRLPGGSLAFAFNPANPDSKEAKQWGSPIGYDRQSLALSADGATWDVRHDFVRQVDGKTRVVHSTITGLPDGSLLLTLPNRSTLLKTRSGPDLDITQRPAANSAGGTR